MINKAKEKSCFNEWFNNQMENKKIENCRIMYNMSSTKLDEDKVNNLCNYLILIEHSPDYEEVIPCNTMSRVIDICSNEKRLCRVYERNGSIGKNWRYLCDISKGVI